MKTLFISYIYAVALALCAFGQTPMVPPATIPAQSAAPAASVAPTASATASNDLSDRIQRRIEKRFGHKGLHFQVGDENESGKKRGDSNDDIPEEAIPIIAVVMFSVFGAPVLIVAVIMYFGFSKNRMMHRTIRMMVEKGQPVPAALLASPAPAQRQRSDMRRGVVLVMVGLGLMLFLGAVNDWEGGAWSLGIIPFLIGAGYLLVWKLEGKKDIPPPPPAQ
ncbi:MAG TPA: DUF6249 domain-containing protein [Chthoniobacterales bacterium]|jgi:hypothetical protein|nr:DUF6249 domain-containing protein [Chthoniobacterales bacterium]